MSVRIFLHTHALVESVARRDGRCDHGRGDEEEPDDGSPARRQWPQVQVVQTHLVALGFPIGTDGVVGARTDDSVRGYQLISPSIAAAGGVLTRHLAGAAHPHPVIATANLDLAATG